MPISRHADLESNTMPAETLELRLLGRFEVLVDGQLVDGRQWRRKRAVDVVKVLALAPRHRLAREQLMEAFWPDLEPQAAGANLRKAAYHARRALGLEDGVVISEGLVRLAPRSAISSDVDRFDRVATAAMSTADVEGCRVAASLYGGELLPDNRYDDWCIDERQRLHALYLEVLAAGQLWGRLVEVDPTNETAHRRIIKAHLENRDRGAALRQFERLRLALRDNLGVFPDSESVGVYEKALAMEGRDTPTPAERARSLLAWGMVHWERSDIDEAQLAASEARSLAIDAGLGRELADASELLGLIAYAQGGWREVFGTEFTETIRRTPELAPFVFDAHMCMIEFALFEQDGVKATTDLSEEIIRAAEESGSVHGMALGLLLRGEARLLTGDDPAAAAEDLDEASRLHTEVDSLTGQAITLERRAQLASLGGRRDQALMLHHAALDMAAHSAVAHHLYLWIYGGMMRGVEAEEALRVVAEAEQRTADLKVCDPCSMPFHIEATVAAARTGRRAQAERHLAEAERVATMWPAGPWHAAVLEARSEILLSEGAPSDQVVTLLHEAAESYGISSHHLARARCLAAASRLS